jgi:multiple sugar transport system permease protein
MAQNTVVRDMRGRAPQKEKGRRSTSILRWMFANGVPNYILLALGAVLFVMPFIWMVSTSFKPRSETVSIPPRLLPKVWTLRNYKETFARLDIVRLYANTFYVAISRTVVGVYTSTLLGYIFAKFRFWGRDAIFLFLLGTMIIPFSVYMVALYVMWVQIGLADKLFGLIIGGFFDAYGIFLARQFMHTVPNGLIDAARIDGAGELRIFHTIVIRLSVPVMATLAAFEFMGQMNNFLWPLIVISSETKYTLALGLATFTRQLGQEHGLTMAGAVFTTVPMLIVFVTMQKQIVQGISFTGFK